MPEFSSSSGVQDSPVETWRSLDTVVQSILGSVELKKAQSPN